MARTKKVKIAGKFGVRYGSNIREKYRKIATKQAQKQQCPFCKKPQAKRTSTGIWYCKVCNKKFASRAYYLNT